MTACRRRGRDAGADEWAMAGLIKPTLMSRPSHTSPNCQISPSHKLGHRGVYRT
jgi:hypothetical protein